MADGLYPPPDSIRGSTKDSDSTFRQFGGSAISEQTVFLVEVYKFNDFIHSAHAAKKFSGTRQTFTTQFGWFAFSNMMPLFQMGYGGSEHEGLKAFGHMFGFDGNLSNRHVGTLTSVSATKSLAGATGNFQVTAKVGIPTMSLANSIDFPWGMEMDPEAPASSEAAAEAEERAAPELTTLFQREYDFPVGAAHGMVDEGDFVVISSLTGSGRYQTVLAEILDGVSGLGVGDAAAFVQWQTVMIGRVDKVNISVGISSGGGTEYDFNIAGRDFQGVLQDVPLYFNPFDSLHNNAEGRVMARILSANQTISGQGADVIKTVLSLSGEDGAMLGYAPNIPIGGGGSEDWYGGSIQMVDADRDAAAAWGYDPGTWILPFWFALDTTHIHDTYGYIHAWDLMQPGEFTPLWQLAQKYQNPEFNEMWMDTMAHECPLPYNMEGAGQHNPRKMRVHYREKPFENLAEGPESPWFKLTTHPISTNRITSITANRGTNRLNHVQLTIQFPGFMGIDQAPLCPPIFCPASIERHGIKRKVLSLPIFVDTPTGSVVSTFENVKEYRDKYVQWNVLAPYYYSGDISISGAFPAIRPGLKIRIDDWEKVSHATNAPFAPLLIEPGFDPNISELGELADSEEDRLKDGHWVGDELEYFTAYVDSVSWTWSAGESPMVETKVTYSRGYIEKMRIPHIQRQMMLWGETTDPATWRNAAEPHWSDPAAPEEALEEQLEDVEEVVPVDSPPEVE